MTLRRVLYTGMLSMLVTVGVGAQTSTRTTQQTGDATIAAAQMTGEVVAVEGNLLLARSRPDGALRLFEVRPERQFIIDGQPKRIQDLRPGTVLTATVVVAAIPVTERTRTTLSGTVWRTNGNYVVLTLDSGQNRAYTVPDSYRFVVNGKPATVYELRQGMKIAATKIVEEPLVELVEGSIVTGTAPK